MNELPEQETFRYSSRSRLFPDDLAGEEEEDKGRDSIRRRRTRGGYLWRLEGEREKEEEGEEEEGILYYTCDICGVDVGSIMEWVHHRIDLCRGKERWMRGVREECRVRNELWGVDMDMGVAVRGKGKKYVVEVDEGQDYRAEGDGEVHRIGYDDDDCGAWQSADFADADADAKHSGEVNDRFGEDTWQSLIAQHDPLKSEIRRRRRARVIFRLAMSALILLASASILAMYLGIGALWWIR